MTIEEAKNLKSGDVIAGRFGIIGIHKRIICSCEVDGPYLRWWEKHGGGAHEWPIDKLQLVRKKDGIINNYSIY